MARPIRIQFPGAVYHVMSRGNEGRKIFLDPKDYQNFLAVFFEVRELFHIICYAYCLMPNHYHLLIKTPDPNLSLAMRQLNGKYTQKFNFRHKRFGHLFQGRYKSVLVDLETYRYEVIRYFALNPVKAKMVKFPGDWKWSSHNEMTGKQKKPSRCLDRRLALKLFGKDEKKAKEDYLANIAFKMEDGLPDRKFEGGAVAGSPDFIAKLASYFQAQAETKEIPRAARYAHRPDLKKMFNVAAGRQERNKLLAKAYREYGYTLSQISQVVGLHYATISRIINQKRKG